MPKTARAERNQSPDHTPVVDLLMDGKLEPAELADAIARVMPLKDVSKDWSLNKVGEKAARDVLSVSIFTSLK